MPLLVMNSLYSEKGQMTGTFIWSRGKTFTPCAVKTIIFPPQKFKLFNICLTQGSLLFQYL